MWTLILRFLNWLFGKRADTTQEISGKATVPDKSPVAPTLPPPPPKTEPPPPQKIDWEQNPPLYRKRKSLLTFHEREFYRLLRGQVGNEYHVFAAVRMADVLWLEDESDNRKFFNNQIQCKHFDYVVCDKLKFEPVLIVELDDSSHHWYDHWERDDFKNRACQMAGLPLLRIKAQEEYDREEIGQQIRELIEQQTTGQG